MRIVIYSEYVEGNGDLTFGCKMAAKIRQQYPDADIQVVTIPKKIPWDENKKNPKGMELEKSNKLRNFNKDNPYPVSHLDDYMKSSPQAPDMIIVGPVVMPGCKNVIELLSGRANRDAKVLLISEYGFKQEHLEKIKAGLENLKFSNVAVQATGVTDEKGIFIDREIAGFDRADARHIEVATKSLGNVGTNLYGKGNLSDYLKSHEVAVHYSHNNAERVVNVHARYVEANKDMDLVVLGESNKNDRAALIENIDLLKRKGFGKVVYVDCPNEPEILYDDGRNGPAYRIVHTGKVSLEQSLALRKISGEFSGATGDQSYSEALSRSPIVIYETMVWKKDFLEDQVKLAKRIDSSGNLPKAVSMMGSAKSKAEYDELAVLLKDPHVKEGLKLFRQQVMSNHDLQTKLDKTFKEVNEVAAKKEHSRKSVGMLSAFVDRAGNLLHISPPKKPANTTDNKVPEIVTEKTIKQFKK